MTLTFGIAGFLSADNKPPYSYNAAKSYIKPDPAGAGRQVTIHWEVKNNRYCPGFITRSIIDAKTKVIVSYDPFPALFEEGEHFIDRSFYLPDSIEPGIKIYRVNGVYFCNILQRLWPLKVQSPDIFFEID